jgi:murein DD-endopeptidase MepM/ murein hydrolase activator NlpD
MGALSIPSQTVRLRVPSPRLLLIAGWLGIVAEAAQPFQPPTANHSLFEPGGEARFVVGTEGKPWSSGGFGCVRSGGDKFHEGIDIRCLQRDRRGEPLDSVLASASGTVAYISNRPQLSNYGNYIVLRHSIEGMEVFTLYAHLGSIRLGLKVGDTVNAGERIATMGRTTNTREPISKERAHCHFEIDLLANERFPEWHSRNQKGLRNDHGIYNGHNLLGLDPWQLFLEQKRLGTNFSLVGFIQGQSELARIVVRTPNLSWARRYRALVMRNPIAEREGIAAYELVLAFNGLPIRLIPRGESELRSKARISVRSVNESVQLTKPCCHLVTKRGGVWMLQASAERLLSLLTF